MKRRNFIRLFDRRKSQIDARVRRDYVKNGIGTIFCRISGYHDVITAYSVKDHETMNLEFVDYLRGAAKVIPAECPLVLNIIGGNLSEEEKETIETVVRDDFAYDFGMTEQEEKRERNIFLAMFLGLLVAGLLLALTQVLDEVPREVFFVLFWFFGDTMFEYIFFTGHDLRQQRRLAGRLASIKVIFSEEYEAPEYTENDLDKLYTEIAQDAHETVE